MQNCAKHLNSGRRESCEKGTVFSVVLLFATIILGLCYLLIAPKQSFSEEENRVLEKMPKASVSDILQGTYMTRAEHYVEDHFAFRKYFIELNTAAQFGLGRRDLAGNYTANPAEGGIYFGENHHLYEVLLPDQSKIFEQNAEALNYFAKKASVPVYILPIPSGSQMQPEYLPQDAPNYDQRIDLKQLQNTVGNNAKVIDVFQTLALSTGQDYYYKTDHHWNIFGAYEGYASLMNSMKMNPTPKETFTFEPVQNPFYGTLYSKALAPWQQPDVMYLPVYKDAQPAVTQQTGTATRKGLYWQEYLSKKDKYSVFLGGNHGVDIVRNPQAKEGRLLIIKDSFANSMIPFLATNFKEIHIVDLRYYNQNIYDYIKKNQVNSVAAIYSIKQLSDVNLSGKLRRGSETAGKK